MDEALDQADGLPRSNAQGEVVGRRQASAAKRVFDYCADSAEVSGAAIGNTGPGMSYSVVAAKCSHRGRVRRINEDSVAISAPIFAVADGMGGHHFGDVASSIVATVLEGLGREGPHTQAGIRGALELANLRIRRETPQGDDAAAGTTVVGVLLGDGESVAFNIGDSRLYVCKRGAMRQLSKDHSVVQELVDLGEINASDAPQHRQRNVITRAVGLESQLEIDMWELEPDPGDRYLLASDGLTGELDDDSIAAILTDNAEPEAAAAALVDAALASGGRDNVTVVVIDIQERAASYRGTDIASERFVVPSTGDTTERRRRREAAAAGRHEVQGDEESK